MQEWFYAKDGEQRGPVDAAQIKTLYAQGQIDAETLVWSTGMSDWLPLATQTQALGIRSPTSGAGAMPTPVIPESPKPPAAPTASPYAPPRAASPHDDGIHAGYAGGAVVQAGFLRRWAALIVDSLILGVGLIAAIVLISLPLGFFSFDGDGETIASMAQAAYYLLYIIVAPVYYAGMESSAAQATLGKRLIGIKVVDAQGRRLSFMHALGRWVAAITGYITLYIGFLLAAFTEKKQALHDLIASTYVVDKWAYTEFPERQRSGPAGCLVIGLVLLLPLIAVMGILAAIAIPTYQDYTQRARVSQVLVSAGSAKVQVSEYLASNDRCPQSWDEMGTSAPTSPYVTEVELLDVSARECQISLTVDADGGPSGELWLNVDENQRWTCSSDLPSRVLPISCR